MTTKSPTKSSWSQSFFRKVDSCVAGTPGYEINNWIFSQKQEVLRLEEVCLEIKKSSKFMMDYGKLNDEDLKDVTDKLDFVFNCWADSINKYSENNEGYRKLIKEIRESEENVFNLRNNVITLASEVDRLAKNKKPTNKLKLELDELDKKLGDAERESYIFKRKKLKEGLQIRFQSLKTFSSKLEVISNIGKELADLIIEIEVTPSDEHAPPYTGKDISNGVVEKLEIQLKMFDNLSVIDTANTTALGTGKYNRTVPSAESENLENGKRDDKENIRIVLTTMSQATLQQVQQQRPTYTGTNDPNVLTDSHTDRPSTSYIAKEFIWFLVLFSISFTSSLLAFNYPDFLVTREDPIFGISSTYGLYEMCIFKQKPVGDIRTCYPFPGENCKLPDRPDKG
ncbi:hypothetical protein HDU92_006602 [Lobulomyces angularis]|nr:hypothetical protein HDU92_006602 [Lobulomyces angularis]